MGMGVTLEDYSTSRKHESFIYLIGLYLLFVFGRAGPIHFIWPYTLN